MLRPHFLAIIALAFCALNSQAQKFKKLYDSTGCGLNYVTVSKKVTTRHATGGTGSGLPVTLNLTGLPDNNCIEAAYVWFENSYAAGSTNNPTFSISNPAGALFNLNLVKIGQDKEKCWGEAGTRSWRADVTNAINSNGNYVINTSLPASEIDGVTMIVIYKDKNSVITGNVVIYDGLEANNSGGTISVTVPMNRPCGSNLSGGKGFIVTGDFQLVNHNAVINGQTNLALDQFWSCDQAATTVTSGQTQMTFGASPLSFDCFAMIAFGMYYASDCGLPDLTVTGDLFICPGFSTTLVGSGAGCDTSYTWEFTDTNCFGDTVKVSKPCTVQLKSKCQKSKEISIRIRDFVSWFARTTPTFCAQATGTITADVFAGPGEVLSYSLDGVNWQSSNVFTNLPPGSYTLYVRNQQGCSENKKVVVSDTPGPVSVQSTQIPTTCNQANGQVIINGVSGGTAPYQFSFNGLPYSSSGNFNNLAAGTYTIKAKDANGCEVTVDVVVPATPPPSSVQAVTTNDVCNQNIGTLKITGVTGGLAPYTYSINGSPFDTSTYVNPAPVGSYLIKAKDANNCQVQTSVAVSMIPGPASFATAVTNSNCGKTDGQITVNNVSGGAPPYNYSINGGAFGAQNSFSNLGAGSYNIVVKDKNGCSTGSPSNIVDQGGPKATVATPSDALCGQSNGSVNIGTVTGGKSPYTYSFDGAAYCSTTSYNSLAAGAHSISIKDDNGCILSITATVGNQPGQSGGKKSVVHETCGNTNGQYSVSNISGGKAPFSYAIDGGSYGPSSIFTNLAAGLHSIMVKDANGCLLQLDSTLFNFTGPTGINTVTSPEYCSDQNGSLSVTSTTGGTLPVEYSLDGVNFVSANTFQGLTAGAYTVYIRDANKCLYNQPDVVQGFTGPIDLTFSHNPSTCGQINGTLTVTGTTGGVAPYTYSIDGQPANASLIFPNIKSGNHTVEVIDANGCSYSESYTVTDVAGPVGLNRNVIQPTCGFSNGSIHIISGVGGTAPYLFSVDGSAYTSQMSYGTLLPGIHSLAVQDANGCVFSDQETLTDLPGPYDLILSTTATTCGQSNGYINVTSVSGGNGGTMYSLNGGAYGTQTTFGPMAAGKYMVLARDKFGCSVSQVVDLIDAEGPTNFMVNPLNDKCTAGSGRITVSNVISGTQPFTYSKNGVDFQNSPVFNGLSAGNYTITVKDVNGCSFTRPGTISDTPGPSNFSLDPKSSTCGYSNGSLIASSVAGGTAPYQYSLDGAAFTDNASFNGLAHSVTHTVVLRDANNCELTRTAIIPNIDGPISAILSATSSTCGGTNGSLNVDQVNGGTPPYKYSIDGEQYKSTTNFDNLVSANYKIFISDANACLIHEFKDVPDIAGPGNFDEVVTAENCKRVDGSVTIRNIQGGTAPFNYFLNGIPFNASNSETGLAAGSYSVMVVDANGCERIEQVSIPYFDFPKAAFDLDPQIGDNPLVVNFFNRSEDAVTYDWAFGTGDSSTAVNPYYTYTDSGTYVVTLTAYNSAGCSDVTSKVVRSKMPTYVNIPNAFTPNNDNVNDYFNASTYGFKSFVMTLNNRWGDKILEWNINDKGWNGEYLGSPAKDDVYVWVFVGTDIYGKKYRYTGHVSLLR